MTIAFIGQKGLPARSGGVERHVALLAAGLASRGHRIVVYGRRWYVRGPLDTPNVELRLTRGLHLKYFDAMSHALTALWDARQVRPDIIHFHGSGVALLTPLTRMIFWRAKIVVTFHCEDWKLSKWHGFGWVFKLGERFACHLADRTITVSQQLVRYCLEHYGCQAVYIPHPFQLPNRQPAVGKLAAHELDPERYFLFVGRLIQDKQAHRLIEAYDLARKQRPELLQRITLVIVGAGSWTDGYVRWLYQQAAAIPGVKLIGERTDEELAALQAYALAHVFPTTSEGLSLAILEAAAYRRPLVMTDLMQNREATGGKGIRVQPQDTADLARGMIAAAALSPSARQEMGDALFQHLGQRFHYQDRIDDVVRVYAELTTGNPFLVSPATAKPARA